MKKFASTHPPMTELHGTIFEEAKKVATSATSLNCRAQNTQGDTMDEVRENRQKPFN